jgi:hypothetical protein
MSSEFSSSSTKRFKKVEKDIANLTSKEAQDIANLTSKEAQDITNLSATAQMTKITNDTGGAKLSALTVNDDILQLIRTAGKGLHTIYAATGSQNLPPTNTNIRGFSHFTDVGYGWITAIDVKNNVFTNYCSNNVWSGWRHQLGSGFDVVAGALNSMNLSGVYYVNPGTTNAPTANAGCLTVENADTSNMFFAQTFVDFETGSRYTRVKYSGTWQPWRRLTFADEDQSILWSGAAYMTATSIVTPTTPLSRCRNGWILVWSDYDPGTGSNDYDIAYSFIPKGTPFSNGESGLFSIPNFLSASASSLILKRLYVSDTKLVGHTDNNSTTTGTYDVVLRYVMEW